MMDKKFGLYAQKQLNQGDICIDINIVYILGRSGNYNASRMILKQV